MTQKQPHVNGQNPQFNSTNLKGLKVKQLATNGTGHTSEDDTKANDTAGQGEGAKDDQLSALLSQMFSLKDAYSYRPPLEYVVDNLFSFGSMSIVYGAPGCMKSMLLADMAASVVAGQPWLPGLPTAESASITGFKTTQVPVLWIDYDNGKRRTHNRIESVARARGLADDAPLHYMSMAQPALRADSIESVLLWEKIIKQVGAKLIIIDNLGLISGDAEENSADMVNVMGNLRLLTEKTDAATVIIHHQRKGDMASRVGELLRGHSSIESSLDLALLVAREKQEDQHVTIQPTKVRDAGLEKAFCAEFTYSHKVGLRELESAKFWGKAIMSANEAENLEIAVAAKIVLQREKDEMKQGDLVADTKAYMAEGGKKTTDTKITGVIKSMAAGGFLLTRKGDAKNSTLYRLP